MTQNPCILLVVQIRIQRFQDLGLPAAGESIILVGEFHDTSFHWL